MLYSNLQNNIINTLYTTQLVSIIHVSNDPYFQQQTVMSVMKCHDKQYDGQVTNKYHNTSWLT